MITYETAQGAAVQHIAARLREADKQEVWLATGNVPALAVYEAYRTSKFTWTASVNGIPECVFGLAQHPTLESTGVPWMVGTDVMLNHQIAMLRDAKRTVEQMQARYATLINCVHAENTVSRRWLKALGFAFGDPVPFGPFGATFLPFFRHQQNV